MAERSKIGLLACLVLALAACQRMDVQRRARAVTSSPVTREPGPNDIYGQPTKLGNLNDPAIRESSGVVASRSTPGFYWTHNDSGDGPYIYAFDEHGARGGVWRVAGAAAHDWEDIAAGPGPQLNTRYLYIGDIGDNGERRPEITVYRVTEPAITPADAGSSKADPRLSATAETIHLNYPDGKHDAETLLVHPVTGNIYIITKTPLENPGIYEAVAPFDLEKNTELKRLGELSMSFLGGLITGGDIAPDGRRLALCDYVQGYEISLADSDRAFDAIWRRPLIPIALGKRKQGEAIAYRLDGKALLTTSEGVRAPLLQVVRR